MYLLLVKVYNFIFYIVVFDMIFIILYSIYFFKIFKECVEIKIIEMILLFCIESYIIVLWFFMY